MTTARLRLPDRRASEFLDFQSMGMKFTASVSRDSSGKILELFVDNHKAGSAIGATRTGLSILSWHCRLAQIGRAKVKSEKPKPTPQTAAAGSPFDDPIDDLAFGEVRG